MESVHAENLNDRTGSAIPQLLKAGSLTVSLVQILARHMNVPSLCIAAIDGVVSYTLILAKVTR